MRPPISRSPSTENIDRRVGGRDRGAEQPGGGPAEAEHVVREQRRPARGRERADDAEEGDRHRRRRGTRRQPIERPPSKRITISATVATRITVSFESTSRGKMSEATAATTRNGAAAGTEMRSLSLLAKSAAVSPAATRRMPPPKVVTSSTAADRTAGLPRSAGVKPALTRRTQKLLTFPLLTAYLARKYLVSAYAPTRPPAAALCLVASARGRSPGALAPGDGSLVVSNADGVLTVEVKGVIFGHFDRGKMTVLDWKADDKSALPTVSGAKMDVKGAKANVVYTGTDVRFLFPSGKYKLKFDGRRHRPLRRRQGKLTATRNSLDEGRWP